MHSLLFLRELNMLFYEGSDTTCLIILKSMYLKNYTIIT